MTHKNTLSYIIQYNIKKLSVDFETWRFDREIKKAYQVSSLPGSGISIPSVITEHPLATLLTPIGIGLIALTLVNAPRIKKISFSDTFPIKSISSGFRKLTSKTITTPETETTDKSVTLPIPIQPKPAAKDFLYALIADKTKRTLTLFKYYQSGKTKEEKTYSTMIGAKWGRKQRQGDLKTPEGFYWIVNRMERSELPPIYGARAFILSYPNETDISEGRSGTGIWIHGYEDDKKESTKGCLALDHNDLEDITGYIGIGTPILISESVPSPADSIKKYFTWPVLLGKRDSIIAESRKTESFASTFVERWRVAWESKDIETYASLYDPDFTQNGMAYSEWKEYKRAIFGRSTDISVNTSDIKLLRTVGDTAFIRFTQEYLSGEYRAVNGKMIKVVRSGNDWKIKEETRM